MNKNIVQRTYISLLESYLKGYKVTSYNPLIINFRCPYCGDSKKNIHRKRGYLIEDRNTGLTSYYCHNDSSCSRTFDTFLKEQNYNLYQQYKLDLMKGYYEANKNDEDISFPSSFPNFVKSKIGIKCSSLEKNHEAVYYLSSRKIPEKYFSIIHYHDSLKTLKNSFPNYKETYFPDEPVIVIPSSINGKINYLCCRSIKENSSFRYSVLQINEAPKLWFVDEVDWTKTIFITEGPIDALCLDNAIAISGSHLSGSSLDFIKSKTSSFTFIFDNELRTNKEIKKEMLGVINNGYSLVIYDGDFLFKDINKALVEGWTKEKIMDYIKRRTFKGLQAKLELGKQYTRK